MANNSKKYKKYKKYKKITAKGNIKVSKAILSKKQKHKKKQLKMQKIRDKIQTQEERLVKIKKQLLDIELIKITTNHFKSSNHTSVNLLFNKLTGQDLVNKILEIVEKKNNALNNILEKKNNALNRILNHLLVILQDIDYEYPELYSDDPIYLNDSITDITNILLTTNMNEKITIIKETITKIFDILEIQESYPENGYYNSNISDIASRIYDKNYSG